MGDLVFLSDPSHRGVLAAGGHWIEGSLLGSVATSVAIVAIAWLGFSFLQGRLPLRRGSSVVLGAFIVFGASQIATGIMSFGRGTQSVRWEPAAPAQLSIPQLNQQADTGSVGFDPYAGAAYVPPR